MKIEEIKIRKTVFDDRTIEYRIEDETVNEILEDDNYDCEIEFEDDPFDHYKEDVILVVRCMKLLSPEDE